MLILVTKSHDEVVEARHPRLGRLVMPRHCAAAALTAAAGIPWAADNDCFQGLHVDRFVSMIDRLVGIPGCLFVTCPDVVGDHDATMQLFHRWAPGLARRGLPIGFVLQDGCTTPPQVPWRDISAVFIGGSTEYKLGANAEALVHEAKHRRLWAHMGRVNSEKRLAYAREIGCDSIDGSSWAIFSDDRLDRGLRAAERSMRATQLRM